MRNLAAAFLSLIQTPCIGFPLTLALGVSLVWIRRRARYKANMLSTLVIEARGRLYKRRHFLDTLEFIRDNLYYPSTYSVMVPLCLVVLVVCFEAWTTRKLDLEDSHRLSSLIAVEGGLAAVVFPLAIFLIELTGERSETGIKKSEVVLRESFLFPTVMFVLFCLLGFSVLTKVAAGWILIVLTALGSAWVLFKVIRLLLDDHRVIASGRQVLKDKVRRSIHLAIDERIGNNILMMKLKELGVSPGFFGIDDERDDLCVFRASKGGMVSDVNLERLREFVGEIPVRQVLPKPGEIPAEEEFQDGTGRPEIQFTVRRGVRVAEGESAILAVKKTGEVEKLDQRMLAGIAGEVIEVGAGETYEEVLRAELSRLKDFTLAAIEEKKTGSLRVAIDHYVAVTEAFLEELERCQGVYSSKAAAEELGNIFGRWDEIEDAARDIYEFLERAVSTGNTETAKLVAFLPTKICTRAVKHRDHYLFQRFAGFARYIYEQSRCVADSRLQGFLSDRATQYLKELAEFHIEPQLRRKNHDQDVILDYGDFALELLVVFQSLLKSALDAADQTALDALLAEFREIFQRYLPAQETKNLAYYDEILGQPTLSEVQREGMKSDRERQKSREEVQRRITERKGQIIFGLSSWAVRRWEADPSASNSRLLLTLLNAL